MRKLFSLIEKIRWILRHDGVGGVISRVIRRIKNPALFKTELKYDVNDFVPRGLELDQLKAALEGFDYKPLISIVMPVYNPEPELLKDTIRSVRAQIYPNWELCIADDASTDPQIKTVLNEAIEQDERIKVVFRDTNGHIVEASNTALSLAKGEFVALLDHDDLLAPHALYEVIKSLNGNRTLDLIYSNEDKVNLDGEHITPTFKAAWSPDYFLSFMYIGHLTVYRKSLVDKAGGFRKGFEGSQDYDLALRILDLNPKVHHIPEILYHWRMQPDSVAMDIHAKPYAFKAAKRALKEALERRNLNEAKVQDTRYPGIYRVRFPLKARPCVHLLIDYQDTCKPKEILKNIKKHTAYPNLKVHLSCADNKASFADCASTLDFYKRTIADIQSGSDAGEARIVFFAPNLVPANADWVERLLEQSLRPEVALTGGHITTKAGDHIHGGYILNEGQVYNAFFGAHRLDACYGGRLAVLQNLSAVSEYFSMISMADLFKYDGFGTGYKSALAFILHLAFKAREGNKRVLWTPFAKASWHGDVPAHMVNMKQRQVDFALLDQSFSFGSYIDPYYPKGLERDPVNFKMAKKYQAEVI